METIAITPATTNTATTTSLSDVFKGLGFNALPQYLPTLLDEARLQQLSYEAFLHQVLRVELQGRQQRAMERRIRSARLPFPARLETFDFSFQPTVSERLVKELAGLTFLQTATNVVLLGPPGVGKTHLACAMALRALEAGYTAMFTTLRQLATAMMSPGPRGGTAILRSLSQPKLLVIDEVGYTRLTVEQASALFDPGSLKIRARLDYLDQQSELRRMGRAVGRRCTGNGSVGPIITPRRGNLDQWPQLPNATPDAGRPAD